MNQHQTTDITQAVLDRLAADADPRFKRDHHGRRAPCARAGARGRPEARRVDGRDPVPHPVGQTCDDKRQEFILLSDTLGISMLVVQLEQARRSARALADKRRAAAHRGHGAGPVLLGRRAGAAAGQRHRRGHAGRAGATTAAASPTRTASRSPAAASTSGRATARACTTCRWAATPACGCARASTPTPRAATASGRSSRPSTRCPTTARWATCCARWAATRTGPGHIHMMVYARRLRAADDAPVRRRQPVPRLRRGVRRARQPDRALRAPRRRQGARRPRDGPALPHARSYDFALAPA